MFGVTIAGKRVDWREIRRAFGSAILIAIVVIIVAGAFFLALNLASAVTDDAKLRIKVAEAIEEGNLTAVHRLLNNRERGVFQDNDCLILSMALNAHGTALERAVSPFGRPLIEGRETVEDNPLIEVVCGRLMDQVVNGNEESYRFVPYHRYMHGGRALAELVVPLVGVQGFRNLLLTANSLTLLLVAVITLVRASRPNIPAPARSINLGLCLMSVLLLTLSGVQYFGMSLSIGPADLFVHLLFLAIVSFGAIACRRDTYLAIIGIAAAFIIYFEFLTGQIPLGVALVILLPFFCLTSDEDVPEAVLRSVLGTFVFCTICLGLMLAKYGVTALVFGPEVWSNIFDQLEERTSLGEFSLFEVFARLAYRTHHIAYGSTVLGLAYLVLAIGLFFHCFWRDLQSGTIYRQYRAFGLLAAALSILVWYLAFSSHSAIHSWFMIRPIGLFAAMACSYKILEISAPTNSSRAARATNLAEYESTV